MQGFESGLVFIYRGATYWDRNSNRKNDGPFDGWGKGFEDRCVPIWGGGRTRGEFRIAPFQCVEKPTSDELDNRVPGDVVHDVVLGKRTEE